MSILHFLYFAGPYPWNVGNVYFTFMLCVITLCMMYVYIYIWLRMWGWLCTSYDELLWLHERPSLITSALDLVVCICTLSNWCRCIFMLYCVHDHRGVIVLIHVTKWHWFTHVCGTHQLAWCFERLWLVTIQACRYVPVYIDAKPYRYTIAHQTQNSAEFSPWKWGIPIAIFSRQKLGENSIWCTMTHLRRSAARFSLGK